MPTEISVFPPIPVTLPAGRTGASPTHGIKNVNGLNGIMKAAASLLPMSDAFCQMEILQAPSEHYGLRAEEPELTMLGQLIKQKVGTGTQIPIPN